MSVANLQAHIARTIGTDTSKWTPWGDGWDGEAEAAFVDAILSGQAHYGNSPQTGVRQKVGIGVNFGKRARLSQSSWMTSASWRIGLRRPEPGDSPTRSSTTVRHYAAGAPTVPSKPWVSLRRPRPSSTLASPVQHKSQIQRCRRTLGAPSKASTRSYGLAR
jgi:hypothetical protein